MDMLNVTYAGKKYSLRKSEFESMIESMDSKAKHRLRVIQGHRVYKSISQFFDRPYRFITFLRHPIERTISHYNYARMREPQLVFPLTYWRPFKMKGSPNSVIASEAVMCERSRFKKWFLENPSMQNTMIRTIFEWFLLEETPIELNRAHLDKAIHVLDKFYYVGLTERFDLDSLYLYNELGIRRGLGRFKISKIFLKPSADLEEIILSKSALDMELYLYFLKRSLRRDSTKAPIKGT